MKLPPYPEYKDSGLPWLGQVPAHWNLLRAKYLMREMDRRSKDESGTLLSVSQYSGVTKRRSREGSEDPGTRSSSLVGYKVAKPGNLVSNIMLAWNGSLGIAPIEGVVSPAYCVYRICIANRGSSITFCVPQLTRRRLRDDPEVLLTAACDFILTISFAFRCCFPT